MKNRQDEYTWWFHPKFWTRHEVLTSWTYGVIQSKSFESDKKYLHIEHKGRFHLTLCSTCQYFMSGSKFLDGITLYVQLVYFMSGSKLSDGITVYKSFQPGMQYWQIEYTGWLNPSFEPDMKYWQIEHTGRFHPKALNQTSWTYTDSIQVLNLAWRTNKLNIQGDSI
jgi:hypothetical protein